jgi:hypothetical protein
VEVSVIIGLVACFSGICLTAHSETIQIVNRGTSYRLKKSSSIRFRTEWSPLLIGDIYQNAGFLATFGSFTSLALRSCYYVFTAFDLGEIGGTETRV